MKLLEFLQEDNGSLSIIRLLLLVVFLNVLIVWDFACYKAGTLVDIPVGVLGILTVVASAKVFQKKSEQTTCP